MGINKWEFSNGHSTGWLFSSTVSSPANWNKWSVGFCGGRKNRGLGEKALEH